MVSTELVSIITPTYNCAKFITETIESVQAQSYQNWEMIIVDDCSTDNTKEIVEQYQKIDPRIKYYCLPTNSGAAEARNEALRRAQGRWIAFLDSDDLWSPDKLERQIGFMVSNAYHFSYTDYEGIDEEDHSLGVKVSGPRYINKLGMFSYCWPGCLTVMYDREVLGLVQIPNIKKNNDYAMWLKAIKKADCHLLKENLAKYRKRRGSISSGSYTSLIKWHYRLFREVEGSSRPLAALQTANNLFFGLLKKILYVKKSN
ncbi:MAG: glycosyltransferase family 2 protein [Bacteroides sp.]|nr:glycosyltransferase family 2 protein [Bacteroides sp.]